MKRKIIKQGHGTLTITLPKKWVEEQKINSGDEIELDITQGGLSIVPKPKDENKKVDIDITGLDIPTIWKYLMGVYREGYTEIKINFEKNQLLESPYLYLNRRRNQIHVPSEKKHVLERLQGFIDRFIGLEIIEHGSTYIIVKEMGNLTDKEFHNSLRRIFFLINQMSNNIIEGIKSNSPEDLKHIPTTDVSIDKFHDYCFRILNQLKHKHHKNLYFTALFILELMGDEFRNIAIHISEDFKGKSLKNLLIISKTTNEQIKMFHKLFFKFEKKSLKELTKIDKKEYISMASMYENTSEIEREIYYHYRSISRYINALIELRIEMEY